MRGKPNWSIYKSAFDFGLHQLVRVGLTMDSRRFEMVEFFYSDDEGDCEYYMFRTKTSSHGSTNVCEPPAEGQLVSVDVDNSHDLSHEENEIKHE